MSKSEDRFRTWLGIYHKGAYIRKIPDFKQLASPVMRGLPDYIVIDKGQTYWYEVKLVKGTTLRFSAFTEPQLTEFKKMLKEGGYDVCIAVYSPLQSLKLFSFSELLEKGEIPL